jgi:hypothetical protein
LEIGLPVMRDHGDGCPGTNAVLRVYERRMVLAAAATLRRVWEVKL